MCRQLHDCSRGKWARQDLSGSWAPLAPLRHFSCLARILRRMTQASSVTTSFVQFRVTFVHLERRLTVACGAPYVKGALIGPDPIIQTTFRSLFLSLKRHLSLTALTLNTFSSEGTGLETISNHSHYAVKSAFFLFYDFMCRGNAQCGK